MRILKNVVARPTHKYSSTGDPIIDMNKHEASLLGKSDNYNHLAVRDMGFKYLERANADVDLLASASQGANVEPKHEGKNEKKDMRKREKPQSESLCRILERSPSTRGDG